MHVFHVICHNTELHHTPLYWCNTSQNIIGHQPITELDLCYDGLFSLGGNFPE